MKLSLAPHTLAPIATEVSPGVWKIAPWFMVVGILRVSHMQANPIEDCGKVVVAGREIA